ncbi:MAG: GNAT family N-acetyltransferase [Nocardioides sp.]
MKRLLSGDAAVRRTEAIALVDRRFQHPDTARLLQAFRDEQVGRYGFADPIVADRAEYDAPYGAFLVAYRNGRAGGCGGLHWFDRAMGVAEIKKLYAVPEMRGHGLGRLMLVALERRAVARGARQILLESGTRNHAALHLFHGLGYQPIPGYADARDPEINRAFAKTLAVDLNPPVAIPMRASG